MAKSTAELIDEQAAYLLESLHELEFGSEEHQRGVEDICKLCNVNIEANKNADDWEAKDRDLNLKEKELEIKDREEKDENRQRLLTVAKDVAIGLGTFAGGCYMYWAGLKLGLLFEQEGTIAGKTTKDAIAAELAFVKRAITQ